MKNVYIWLSTNIDRGEILVKPEDFINRKCNTGVDRAILDELYKLRNICPVSAHEIVHALQHKHICKNFHTFAVPAGVKHACPLCNQESQPLLNLDIDHAERTVRNHLSSLCAQGYLQKGVREPTGEKGRAPEVYQLSDPFKMELEDYLNTKEMELHSQLKAAIRCEGCPTNCPDPDCKMGTNS